MKPKKTKRTVFILLMVVFLFVIGMLLWVHLRSKGWPFSYTVQLRAGEVSESLRTVCLNEYEISIPESAVLVGGYFSNALREPYAVIAFDIPISDEADQTAIQKQLFSKSDVYCAESLENMVELSTLINRDAIDFDREYRSVYQHTEDAFPSIRRIYVSDPHDGMVSFCIVGPQYSQHFITH